MVLQTMFVHLTTIVCINYTSLSIPLLYYLYKIYTKLQYRIYKIYDLYRCKIHIIDLITDMRLIRILLLF